MYLGKSSTSINQNFSYPYHTNGMNMTPVLPAFGEHHQSNSSNALHSHFNPGQPMYRGHHIQNHGFWVHPSSVVYKVPLFYPRYQTSSIENQALGVVSTASGYQIQQIQQGFGFPQNPATDGEPSHYNGSANPYDYMQQQVMIDNPVNQVVAQAPSQQVQGERNAREEEVVEQPLFPKKTARGRLRWTPELQRRFARASEDLGGYFSNYHLYLEYLNFIFGLFNLNAYMLIVSIFLFLFVSMPTTNKMHKINYIVD